MSLMLFAKELEPQGFLCLAIHPGWVATDMGSSGGRKPPLTAEQSIGGILSFLNSEKPKNGGFYDQKYKYFKKIIFLIKIELKL